MSSIHLPVMVRGSLWLKKNYSKSWPGICGSIFNNQAFENPSLFSQAMGSTVSLKSLLKLEFFSLHFSCDHCLLNELEQGRDGEVEL